MRRGLLRTERMTAFFHGSEVVKFQGSWAWERMMRRLYARVDRYAVASRYVEELVRGSTLVSCGKPLIIASCAVPSGLQCNRPAPPASRDLRVLTVARLHPRKGQVETALALGKLPEPLKQQLVYVMAGTGEESYRAKIEAACRQAGVRHEFLGAVEDLSAVYQNCDVYVQTSQSMSRSIEGFGISYLEAAAFGKPAVGINTGGVGEAVIDGVTGFLAPEGDLDAVARFLEQLLTDSNLRRRMGEAGRTHANAFSWEASARALLS